MIQSVISYIIIALAVAALAYLLFFKKGGQGNCCESGCDGCPYCSSCDKKPTDK